MGRGDRLAPGASGEWLGAARPGSQRCGAVRLRRETREARPGGAAQRGARGRERSAARDGVGGRGLRTVPRSSRDPVPQPNAPQPSHPHRMYCTVHPQQASSRPTRSSHMCMHTDMCAHSGQPTLSLASHRAASASLPQPMLGVPTVPRLRRETRPCMTLTMHVQGV